MGKKIISLTKEGEVQFANIFLEEYLARGFGALSKREIDVLMMSLLINYTNLVDISNFDLSVKLKLTEAKIKNLKYEANLKYRKDLDEFIKNSFMALLDKAILREDTTVTISIEDSFIRHAISAKVKDNGSFTDSSFNSEIVKIHCDDFIYLLDFFYDEKEKNKIEKEVRSLVKSGTDIDFKKLFKLCLEEASKEVGKQGAILGVGYVAGGVFPLIEQIKSLLKG